MFISFTFNFKEFGAKYTKLFFHIGNSFLQEVEVLTNFGHLLSQVNKSLILWRDICY